MRSAEMREAQELHMHYPKAPIVEAVIDFHFAEKVPLIDLTKSAKAAGLNYPFCTPDNVINYKIDAIANRLEAEVLQHGFRLSSNDQSEIAIHREQNFIASKLAPYETWEVFVERAKRDWQVFIKSAKPGRIDRIGLRYVNRIDVPMPAGEVAKVEDYLEIWPRLPHMNGEFRIENYMMQVQRPLPDGFNLIINSAPSPSPLPEHASFFLDIDVYTASTFTKKDLWEILGKMREHKNEIFECLITEKARELFR